ncbi:hypothetical protein EGW08_021675 [Elysia chlorotica]|uniref:Uncharacterized protein n=1 Tax=Elysia chlorotica TaxID=188477 RepID=A0A3S0Z6P3_ELYCH|nr:hypothetical protein EGW08_021675 [Elysia chlorotica]
MPCPNPCSNPCPQTPGPPQTGCVTPFCAPFSVPSAPTGCGGPLNPCPDDCDPYAYTNAYGKTLFCQTACMVKLGKDEVWLEMNRGHLMVIQEPHCMGFSLALVNDQQVVLAIQKLSRKTEFKPSPHTQHGFLYNAVTTTEKGSLNENFLVSFQCKPHADQFKAVVTSCKRIMMMSAGNCDASNSNVVCRPGHFVVCGEDEDGSRCGGGRCKPPARLWDDCRTPGNNTSKKQNMEITEGGLDFTPYFGKQRGRDTPRAPGGNSNMPSNMDLIGGGMEFPRDLQRNNGAWGNSNKPSNMDLIGGGMEFPRDLQRNNAARSRERLYNPGTDNIMYSEGPPRGYVGDRRCGGQEGYPNPCGGRMGGQKGFRQGYGRDDGRGGCYGEGRVGNARYEPKRPGPGEAYGGAGLADRRPPAEDHKSYNGDHRSIPEDHRSIGGDRRSSNGDHKTSNGDHRSYQSGVIEDERNRSETGYDPDVE